VANLLAVRSIERSHPSSSRTVMRDRRRLGRATLIRSQTCSLLHSAIQSRIFAPRLAMIEWRDRHNHDRGVSNE
jgi:hypothetical protein